MKNLFIFIQQISKSVLPYHYINIINSPYLRLFRFVACIAIIVLFIFKSLMNSYSIYFLLTITYSYMLYQCIIVIMKIYYIQAMFNSNVSVYKYLIDIIITNNTKIIYG